MLAACERETHMNIPPQPPKLATESFSGQNVFPEAYLTRTRGVTDPLPISGQTDIYLVRNATVLLYENDILKDSLKYNAGQQRYKAAIAKIQAGKTYKLVLSAPGFPTAEAISVTPLLVPINNMTFTRNARNDIDGNPQDEVKLSFTDNGSTEDYYLVRIYNSYHDILYCVITNDKDVEKLVYEDPFYPDDCLQSNRLLLSDKNFNGTNKTLIFYTEAGELEPTPGSGKAWVELLHVNKEYYTYIKSLNTRENADDNPFAEPVNLYTNVKNGYGMFTTYAMAVDSIQ
jgi:hypothetical protein